MLRGMIDSSWYRRPPGTPQRITAGGLVLAIRDGEVLVALAREGLWPLAVIAKGGVDPGESVEAAARREIAEETGLTDLALLAKMGVLERLTFNQKRWTVTHVFAYLTTWFIPTPQDEESHPQPPVWCSLDTLPAMLWPDQRRLIEDNRPLLRRLVLDAGATPPAATAPTSPLAAVPAVTR